MPHSRALRRVLHDGGTRSSPPEPPVAAEDQELLDAYSNAVIAVVERVGPAVVSLSVRGQRDGMRAGSGSGVLFTPHGHGLDHAHALRGRGQLPGSRTAG